VTHELASLYSWLQHDDEFRGRVKTVTADLKPGDMGGVTETLTVALGSGGAVAALGGTLNAWIAARRTKVSQVEDSRPQPPSDTVQRILEGKPHEIDCQRPVENPQRRPDNSPLTARYFSPYAAT
jgi:hypothetical protein